MDKSEENNVIHAISERLTRPPGHLHDLPVNIRWEVTRRHPLYLVFWENALRYRRGESSQNEIENQLYHVAYLMLGLIGVTGVPVAPCTTFQELDRDSQSMQTIPGAVQPMTLRNKATMFLQNLPSDDLQLLARLFDEAADEAHSVTGDDESLSLQRQSAIGRLARHASSALDSYPDAPLFYIHMDASQRTIVDDTEAHVRNFKTKRGIKEKRIHTGKLQSYLDVWDLREGWTGESYQNQSEQTLKSIGKEKRQPISTIVNLHRSAFKLITGHEFSPSSWAFLMGPIKIAREFQIAENVFSIPIRHAMRSPVKRDVPETVLQPRTKKSDNSDDEEEGRTSLLELKATVGDFELADMWMDIETMIDEGRTDQEIAGHLVCSPDSIALLRSRLEEFRSV